MSRKQVEPPVTTKNSSQSIVMAMAAAAAVTAQFVSAKAVRDALFLTSLDLGALPSMVMATSVCSILMVVVNARIARRMAPAALVPVSFAVSGVLFVLEWLFRARIPAITAVVVYLHISAAGPVFASGFWLIASERFDPRTAKKRYGHLAAAGTLGGLVSALVTERVGAVFGLPAMLAVLAALQFVCAWLVRDLAATGVGERPGEGRAGTGEPVRSALAALRETPQLRNLAVLVLLGTTSSALVDYLFKGESVGIFGRGDNLLRFFAIYYAATSLIAFVLQTSASRPILERFGVAFSAGAPSGALLAGSLAGLAAPGFGSILAARGGEAVFRSSLFRAGYELVYTPIPGYEKRSAKALIDVGFDRLGDGVGGSLVRLAMLIAPGASHAAILSMAILCSAGALAAASRLNRGYLGTLEHNLIDLSKRSDGDLQDAEQTITGTRLLRLFKDARVARTDSRPTVVMSARADGDLLDPEMRDILSLRSRNAMRVIDVLSRAGGLTAGLVPHVIPLLAWDQAAEHAVFALRRVAEEHVGQLADALVDSNQDFAVRRRLARVFSVCVSQRAANGLLNGLDDPRFDVRYQSARSLAAILGRNPFVQVDRERIFAIVLKELSVGRGVWESRRLLEDDPRTDASPLDEFVRTRAGQSLAHVFTLLSLVLPREALQMAFRSLHTDDEYLQGTALEYLEGVLPVEIRQRLWPFIERGARIPPARPREEVMADLLKSHQSIMLRLKDLSLQHASADLAAG